MQNIAGYCQQTFENKNFVDITQQCFALLPQVNFTTNNLNFQASTLKVKKRKGKVGVIVSQVIEFLLWGWGGQN